MKSFNRFNDYLIRVNQPTKKLKFQSAFPVILCWLRILAFAELVILNSNFVENPPIRIKNSVSGQWVHPLNKIPGQNCQTKN